MVVLVEDKEVAAHSMVAADSHMAEGEAGLATGYVVVEDTRKEAGLAVDSTT